MIHSSFPTHSITRPCPYFNKTAFFVCVFSPIFFEVLFFFFLNLLWFLSWLLPSDTIEQLYRVCSYTLVFLSGGGTEVCNLMGKKTETRNVQLFHQQFCLLITPDPLSSLIPVQTLTWLTWNLQCKLEGCSFRLHQERGKLPSKIFTKTWKREAADTKNYPTAHTAAGILTWHML